MNAINRVQLTGNLGSNPQIRSFDDGGKLARFSIATKEEYTSRNGERNTNVQWHNVVAWGKLAEKIESEFQKGSYVSVEGRLSTRIYTDKSGVKRYSTEVVVSDVMLNKRAV